MQHGRLIKYPCMTRPLSNKSLCVSVVQNIIPFGLSDVTG